MNKFDMTIELNEDDVRVAIADYLNHNNDMGLVLTSKDVKIDVGIEINDRQPGDRGTARFKKAVATVKAQRGSTLA